MRLSLRVRAVALAVALSASAAGAKSIQTPIGTIRMDGELPDRDAIPSLFDALDPGRHWFAYMRFYAPTEPYFDRSWKLGDIEVTP